MIRFGGGNRKVVNYSTQLTLNKTKCEIRSTVCWRKEKARASLRCRLSAGRPGYSRVYWTMWPGNMTKLWISFHAMRSGQVSELFAISLRISRMAIQQAIKSDSSKTALVVRLPDRAAIPCQGGLAVWDLVLSFLEICNSTYHCNEIEKKRMLSHWQTPI